VIPGSSQTDCTPPHVSRSPIGRPAALHVVDVSENGLAELVRDLRSRSIGLEVRNFLTMPLDVGSPLFVRFLREQLPYDHVFNFAAIKQVRSERDPVSKFQMFEINVLKPMRFRDGFETRGGTRLFLPAWGTQLTCGYT